MKNAAAAMLAALLLFCAGRAVAHGMRHTVFEGATAVRVSYDDGSPMAFCEAAVFSPDDEEAAYQTGTTDRNGCFAFQPDTNGVWRVTVDDGMGHLATVHIDSGGIQEEDQAAPADRLSGAVVGVSVLFGCFGLYSMFAHRVRKTN